MIRIEFECASEVRDVFSQPEVADLRERNATLRYDLNRVSNELYDLKDKDRTQAPSAKPMVMWMLSENYAELVRRFLAHQCPDNKIQQIKLFREITGCGLKEAKDFQEGTINHV